MRINILIGGKAGQGIARLAEVVSSSLIRAGYFAFNYKDYQSLIRGGHNFNVVSFSEQMIFSQGERIDILLAFDKNTLNVHERSITKETIIATANEELSKELLNEGRECFFLNIKELGKAGNMALGGFLFKLLRIDKKFLINEIEDEFKGKEEIIVQNKSVIEQFYSADYKVETRPSFLDLKDSGIKEGQGYSYISGSEAIAEGAVDAELEVYFGYPMTPSTGVLTALALKQKKNNVNKNLFVFSAENEIAVVNAGLGASFAGRRVMIGTAGGGFDLMTEGLSMQGITEIPLVLHLAQRVGPGTGAPTYTSQADLNAAIYGGHGDFSRLVVAPGDAEEAYETSLEAFYLAEKFNLLSIILTDKHLVESGYTAKIEKSKLKIPARKDFPGLEGSVFKRSSYEHDEQGNTVEDAEGIKKGVEKRLLKSADLVKETKKFKEYKVYGQGENLLVSFGSTKGAVIDALPELKGFSYLHMIYLEPFPDILEILKKAKRIFVIEGNATGQLADLITRNTSLVVKKEERILRYDGRPFTIDFIKEEIKKRVKGEGVGK